MFRMSLARRQRGGTLFGLIAGLLIGLLVAMLVAFYITRAPIPFVNKVGGNKPPAAAQQADAASAGDPNRGLSGKDAPPIVAPSPAPAPASAPASVPAQANNAKNDPLGALLARTPGVGVPAAAPAAPPPATAVADASATYFLQVGAYRVIEDAEALKAKLALQGFQAFLESADLPSGPVNRVRVGPFAKLDDMNRARSRLADSGIQATVIKK